MTPDNQKHVLVVDDEDDVRLYLRTALEDAGFKVSTASDGLEALESVRKDKPDLISLDLVMPRYSGVKFNRDLQKDKEFSKIPVLIVTGHARDEQGKADFESMTMSGPGVYLEKPVKPLSYITAVCQLLNIEMPEMPANDGNQMRQDISKSLADADPEALQKALDALKKKS